MATVYVVCGCKGEYSDRSEWLVRGFKVEGDADAFAKECQRAADDVEDQIQKLSDEDGWCENDIISKVDPNYASASMYMTAFYWVTYLEIEL